MKALKVSLRELFAVVTLTGVSLFVLVSHKSVAVHTITWIVATAALLAAAGVGLASKGATRTTLLAFVAGALIHHNFTNLTSPEYTVIGWAFNLFAGKLAFEHLQLASKQTYLLENITIVASIYSGLFCALVALSCQGRCGGEDGGA